MDLSNLVLGLKDSISREGDLSLEIRKQRLIKLKKTILRKEISISEALKDDLGKSSFETYLTESGLIIEEISYVLKNIDGWAQTKKVRTPLALFPAKSFIRPSPYGVALIISPWNYPFQLCLSPLIGALSAGNRVVIKTSEFAPQTSRVIKEIISEVFLPHEVVVVEGAVDETQLLLKERFDYIFFTGSTTVGKIVMKAAAENLTPVTLELGGKSPLLIEESADLDLAAKRSVWGKFLNAGQTCVAPDYILIPRHLQDSFIEKAKFYLEQFFGKEIQHSPDYPRIVNSKHFERLESLVDHSKVAITGEHDKATRYFAPTVLKNVAWGDKIMKEEIFGPILPVIPYDNFHETLAEIRKKEKPLAFYLFGQNKKKIEEVLSKLQFGGGCVNDTVMHLVNPNLPFGGVGASGIGSYHGRKSFETFSHFSSILVQRKWVDIPLRYPPYKGKLNWIKMIFR